VRPALTEPNPKEQETYPMHPIKNVVRLAPIAGFALLVAASGAAAHTTVRSQATESVTEDNAIRIGHGCETPDGVAIPVVMQSVVFPTVAPVLTASDGSAVPNLAAVIEQGTVAGLVRAIQDRSVFRAQQVKLDALGNRIGFSGTEGSLDPDMPGRTPFQFTGPKFVATGCAKRLIVGLAIADVCVAGAGIVDSVKPGKLNLWIPDNGSQYATLGKPLGIDDVGFTPTLIVNRNLTTNPLPPACGAGIDVTVTPSAADIDANLPIPGVWP